MSTSSQTVIKGDVTVNTMAMIRSYDPTVTTGAVLLTPSVGGELQWADTSGNMRTISCAAPSGATFTFPATGNCDVVDLNAAQTLNNKTITLSGSNTVEANQLMNTPVDVSVPPSNNGSYLKFSTSVGKWILGAPINASAPLSFDEPTSSVAIAVGTTAGTVCAGDDARFSTANLLEVKKTAAGYHQFTSIAAAIQHVKDMGDAAEDNQYVVLISPGLYSEPLLVMPNYTSLVGREIYSVIIEADSPDHDVIHMGHANELVFLTVTGASGVGCSGILYTGLDEQGIGYEDCWSQLHKVQVDSCYYCIHVESHSHCELFLEFVEVYGPYCRGVYQDGTRNDGVLPYINYISSENLYLDCESNDTRTQNFYAEGPGCVCRLVSGTIISMIRDDLTDNVPLIELTNNARMQLQSAYLTNSGVLSATTGGTGIRLSNGAQMGAATTNLLNMKYGIMIANGGTAPKVDMDVLTASSAVECVRVDHPTASGIFKGNVVMAKTFISSPYISLNMYDMGSQVPSFTVGKLYIGAATSNRLELSEYSTTQAVGHISGGNVTLVSGTTIRAAAGMGYLGILSDTVVSQDITLGSAGDYFVYIDNTGTLCSTLIFPTSSTDIILLGYVTTYNDAVVSIRQKPSNFSGKHMSSKLNYNLMASLGCIALGGMNTTFDASDVVTVYPGSYIFGSFMYAPSGKIVTTTGFTQVHHSADNSTFNYTSVSAVLSGFYNPSGSALVALANDEYARHSLYLFGDGADESYFLVVSQNKTTIQAECDNFVNSSLPDWIKKWCVPIADLVTKCGATPTIVSSYDTRPFPNFNRSVAIAPATSTYHSELLGLTSGDDHTQYLRTDGLRALGGTLDLGTHDIVNAGTINSISLGAHGSRHSPTGADPLPLGAAFGSATLNASSTNSRGAAASYALSDHSHVVDIATFSVGSLLGTLPIEHGGTGVTSVAVSKFVTTDAAGLITTTINYPSSTVVGISDTQTLTNKTINSTTNNVSANALFSNSVYNNSATTVTINSAMGPAPGNRYATLAALKGFSGTTAQAAWGSTYETRPTWTAVQTLSNTAATTASAWVVRRINQLIIDPALITDPSPNPTSYPWNCFNFVTLQNSGTATAAIRFTPGIYEIKCTACGFQCNNFYIALYNITTSSFMTHAGTATTIYGSLAYSTVAGEFGYNQSEINAFIDVPNTSDIQVQQFAITSDTTGQGYTRVAGNAVIFANAPICTCKITLVKSKQVLT